MNNFVSQIIVFSIIGGVVWGMSRLLRCKPLDPGIAKPRRSSLEALVATLSILLFAFVMLGMRSLQLEAPGLEAGYTNLGDLAQRFVPLILILLPMVIFIIRAGEPLKSVGITSTNLWQSAVIGSVLVLMMFSLQTGGFSAVLESLKPRHGYSFVYFAFVGFEEEILFRGYLQTRLIAWLGKWQGWLLASAVMAVAHFPQRILIVGMDPGDAFLASCGLIPASLLFGFIMLKTRNVLATGLLHTFTNWISELN